MRASFESFGADTPDVKSDDEDGDEKALASLDRKVHLDVCLFVYFCIT